MAPAFSSWATPHLERIDDHLVSRFEQTTPATLREACQYPLSTGGKRIRALLTLASHESLGKSVDQQALTAACAIEMVHGYSLVHDDLPCMDDDAERRGKPTVHVAFGENTAVLVGDAMLTEAFSMLAELNNGLPLVKELSDAAGHKGMIGGQALDIGMAGPIGNVEKLEALHRGKTGALIRCAVRMGCITAHASEAETRALTSYGECVGLAFQLADDLLDETEDASPDGPPSFVKLLGAQQTHDRAWHLVNTAIGDVKGLSDPSILIALAKYAVQRDH